MKTMTNRRDFIKQVAGFAGAGILSSCGKDEDIKPSPPEPAPNPKFLIISMSDLNSKISDMVAKSATGALEVTFSYGGNLAPNSSADFENLAKLLSLMKSPNTFSGTMSLSAGAEKYVLNKSNIETISGLIAKGFAIESNSVFLTTSANIGFIPAGYEKNFDFSDALEISISNIGEFSEKLSQAEQYATNGKAVNVSVGNIALNDANFELFCTKLRSSSIRISNISGTKFTFEPKKNVDADKLSVIARQTNLVLHIDNSANVTIAVDTEILNGIATKSVPGGGNIKIEDKNGKLWAARLSLTDKMTVSAFGNNSGLGKLADSLTLSNNGNKNPSGTVVRNQGEPKSINLDLTGAPSKYLYTVHNGVFQNENGQNEVMTLENFLDLDYDVLLKSIMLESLDQNGHVWWLDLLGIDPKSMENKNASVTFTGTNVKIFLTFKDGSLGINSFSQKMAKELLSQRGCKADDKVTVYPFGYMGPVPLCTFETPEPDSRDNELMAYNSHVNVQNLLAPNGRTYA